jgi:hypothetical protein
MFGLNVAKINADRPWWSYGAQKGRSRPLAGRQRGLAGGFAAGLSGGGVVAGSSFASAERTGSRRGARRNPSVSMARRIAAVTAARSSSVRSIVGTAKAVMAMRTMRGPASKFHLFAVR